MDLVKFYDQEFRAVDRFCTAQRVFRLAEHHRRRKDDHIQNADGRHWSVFWRCLLRRIQPEHENGTFQLRLW